MLEHKYRVNVNYTAGISHNELENIEHGLIELKASYFLGIKVKQIFTNLNIHTHINTFNFLTKYTHSSPRFLFHYGNKEGKKITQTFHFYMMGRKGDRGQKRRRQKISERREVSKGV